MMSGILCKGEKTECFYSDSGLQVALFDRIAHTYKSVEMKVVPIFRDCESKAPGVGRYTEVINTSKKLPD